MTNSISKEEIQKLLPHREPMLLVDKLINIVPLKSATAIVNVTKGKFYFDGHFPDQPVTQGIPMGEGAGPSRDIANNVDILLSAMYQVNPHPVILQLLNSRST